MHPCARTEQTLSVAGARQREKCKNERKSDSPARTSQWLIALAGERARDYKKCTGEGTKQERGASGYLLAHFLLLLLVVSLYCFIYISCAGRQSHTPLHAPKGGNPEQEEGKDVGGSSASCVPEYKRGFSTAATALLYSQWCWLQFSLIPLLHLVFFLYSSSRREREMPIVSVHAHNARAAPSRSNINYWGQMLQRRCCAAELPLFNT